MLPLLWPGSVEVHQYAFYSRDVGCRVFVSSDSFEKYRAFRNSKSPIAVEIQSLGQAMPVLDTSYSIIGGWKSGKFKIVKPPGERGLNDKDLATYGTYTGNRSQCKIDFTFKFANETFVMHEVPTVHVFEFSVKERRFRWVRHLFQEQGELKYADYLYKLYELGEDDISLLDRVLDGSKDLSERDVFLNKAYLYDGVHKFGGIRQLAELKCIEFPTKKMVAETCTIVSKPITSVKEVDELTMVILCTASVLKIMENIRQTSQYLD